MKPKSLIFIVVALLVGCKKETTDASTKQGDVSANQEDLVDIRTRVNNYLMPFKDSITDKESLIFLKEKRFDTTFVLILRKDGKEASVFYYELSPRNAELGLSTGVLFFDGFRCSIDSATWRKLTDQSTEILDTVNYTSDNGCLDCLTYVLSYGGRSTISGGLKTRNTLAGFDSLLKETIIYPSLKKKTKFN
jgi:hypothetical protein